MTISVPRGLPEIVRAICRNLGIEYSKIFRAGLHTFINDHRTQISPKLYQRYLEWVRKAEGRE